MQKLIINEELIGKYINRCLYTDAYPVGKIVGIKGKTKVLIQPVKASKNKTKMMISAGGFAGHCINNRNQEYDFYEQGEVYEERLSNTKLKNYSWRVQDAPSKFHDYNF